MPPKQDLRNFYGFTVYFVYILYHLYIYYLYMIYSGKVMQDTKTINWMVQV